MRKKGLLPMALVERNHQTVMLQAPVDSLRRAIQGADGHGMIDLSIQGEEQSRKAIIRDVQLDPLKHQIITVTLQEVSDEDEIKLDLPIVAVGHNEDSDAQGIQLTAAIDHIKVKGKAATLPDHIEVDVSNLHVGQHINAGDVALPEGVQLISSPDATLFTMTVVAQPDLQETDAEADKVAADEVPASTGEEA
jgi:large subunit ribosomal protein L25